MLANTKAFSGFSVDDIGRARQFYEEALGIRVTPVPDMGMLMTLEVAGGERPTLIYEKDDHAPASFTVLNFEVDDIDAAVDGLAARGVSFERYEGFGQDGKGVMREQGPNIAWFKDPAGNVLSVIETE